MAIQDYRIQIMPSGVFAHPLRADTLAGHLCWYLAQAEGSAGAQRLVAAAESGAFRISDAFPHGYLPLPVEASTDWKIAEQSFFQAARKKGSTYEKDAGADWHTLRKKARKLTHLAASHWSSGVSRPALLAALIAEKIPPGALLPTLHLRWSATESDAVRPPGEWHSLHTAVNRVSGGAQDGALHERVGVCYPPGSVLDLYLRCEEEEKPRLLAALQNIGLDGHLKRASSGWGRFMLGAGAVRWTPPSGDSDRWVSLSPCVPEQGYAGAAHYKLLPHYGKLGGIQSVRGVFKRPIILLATGASFQGPPPQGCWLKNIHAEHPEVLHYAFAYPLAC
jgi:CRISPR-associated protein Csm4